MSWNHADIVSACSAIIALSAFVLAMHQARATVKHDRLSVKPHINFFESRARDAPVSLSVVNGGVGPAIIRSVTIGFDGISYAIGKRGMPTELFDKLSDSNVLIRCSMLQPGYSLRAGEEWKVFEFTESTKTIPQHVLAVNAIERITLKVGYQSIYGVEFLEELHRGTWTPQGSVASANDKGASSASDLRRR